MTKTNALKFKKLFGAEPESMSATLIISPFFPLKVFSAHLKKQVFFKGLVFKGVRGIYKNTPVTFIHTGMSATLVSDCVLAQEPRHTGKIIFLGAAAAVQRLNVGDCVIIKEAGLDIEHYRHYGFECRQKEERGFFADKGLIEQSIRAARERNIDLKPTRLMSVYSLWDQDESFAEALVQKDIQAIDLECALFYAAAGRRHIKAAALCYISDHIKHRPFWSEFTLPERLAVRKSFLSIIQVSLELIRE
ncbi:MAG: hypothetical protein KJ893_02145 [Candidatus Omnitrophica bacterium]|nr:hypothetical protein [Candidatus Omnitrophota bacterium]MBU4478423.1 hypothetical protein [Candidatus Omnitrophota bacterium]